MSGGQRRARRPRRRRRRGADRPHSGTAGQGVDEARGARPRGLRRVLCDFSAQAPIRRGSPSGDGRLPSACLRLDHVEVGDGPAVPRSTKQAGDGNCSPSGRKVHRRAHLDHVGPRAADVHSPNEESRADVEPTPPAESAQQVYADLAAQAGDGPSSGHDLEQRREQGAKLRVIGLGRYLGTPGPRPGVGRGQPDGPDRDAQLSGPEPVGLPPWAGLGGHRKPQQACGVLGNSHVFLPQFGGGPTSAVHWNRDSNPLDPDKIHSIGRVADGGSAPGNGLGVAVGVQP